MNQFNGGDVVTWIGTGLAALLAFQTFLWRMMAGKFAKIEDIQALEERLREEIISMQRVHKDEQLLRAGKVAEVGFKVDLVSERMTSMPDHAQIDALKTKIGELNTSVALNTASLQSIAGDVHMIKAALVDRYERRGAE